MRAILLDFGVTVLLDIDRAINSEFLLNTELFVPV